MAFFSHFVRAKALPESSSCVGLVTISRKGHKKVDFSRVPFRAYFLLKNLIFQDEPTYPKPRKCCILQIKLDVFSA